jgi:transcriptional regulator with XRE-family HTH domain
MINHIYVAKKMLKDVLKEAREARKLKQTDVAEYVGVTPQTYMKWENGKNEPKASNIKMLAEILKVSEGEICKGEVKHFKMEPFDFIRKVGILISQVPQTEMLIAMHEYINDADGFIKKLTEPESHDIAEFDISSKKGEMILNIIGTEPIEGESEKNKKAREYILALLKDGK